jgi:aminopeptidase YwaD
MNLNTLVKQIWDAYSEKLAYQHVISIARFHRIQASAGYRESAHFVLNELKIAGIDAWIESYPANGHTAFWEAPSFEEWAVEEGMLTLLEPVEQAGVLADFRAVPISLIQRSIPYEGFAQVVLLEDGTKENDYEGLDLTGKIVLTKSPLEKVRRLAVEKHGALGIIYFGMWTLPPVREPTDLPDALQYTSFWWNYYPGEKKCFGFVLSPRAGAHLRQLLLEKKTVKVTVKIKSRLFDGKLDNVVALIPGKTKEEVIVTAHLCHPQPSANDNASGAAAILEMACALKRLITEGTLPQPERSIRFLWVPEMTGSSAYLSTHEAEIPLMIAGINLDMVGEDQNKTGSCLSFVNPPHALSTYTPALLQSVLNSLFIETKEHHDPEPFPLFKYAITGFSGGSDHYIYSDPTVGVPMPAMIQTPDKFYHTSADTPDQTDPRMLRRSGTIAATFAYWIANAGKAETFWLAHELQAHFNLELTKRLQREYNRLATKSDTTSQDAALSSLKKHCDYALACHLQALSSLARLNTDISSTAEILKENASRLAEDVLSQFRSGLMLFNSSSKNTGGKNAWEEEAKKMVPTRLYRGPARYERLAKKLSLQVQVEFEQMMENHTWAHDLTSLAEYWADGKRNCLEITDLIELECGLRDAELVVKTFGLLAKLELVRINKI